MKEVDIVSKIVNREGGAFVPSSKGTQSIDLSDYLLKSIWDKVFEVRTDSQGIEYIFGKLPVVTQYGITMYAGDGVDVPSLASGLPFDGRTIWYNPDTQQIEVIGGTGGGSGEGVSNFWDLSGIPSWITNTKPKYTYSEIEGTPDLTKYALVSQIPSLSGYATESWVLQKNYATKATTLSGYGITDAYTKTNVDDLLKSYVTLGGTPQTITGEKNFVGGLKVNGSPIYYDTEKKYWKLEGDLLVTGGVTMYGSDSSFTPSTIMDAILYDSATLGINSNGQLYVKGGAGGGGLDITALQNYLTQNSYLNVTSGDNRYLMLSGGTLTLENGDSFKIRRNKSNSYGAYIAYETNDGMLGRLGMYRDDVEVYFGSQSAKSHRLLHEGNYSNYALPLSGGTMNGVITMPINYQIQWGSSSMMIYGEDINAIKIVAPLGLYVNSKEVWHKGNFTPSNYLPLSGGTLSSDSRSPLTLKSGSAENLSLLLFNRGSDYWGSIGFNAANSLIFKDTNGANYTIWHSGNDGSGSGLDADLLDGQEGSWHRQNVISFGRVNYTYSLVHDANVAIDGMLYNYGSNTYWRNTPDMSYGQILTLKSFGNNNLMGQLAWDIRHGESDTTRYLWWRAIQDESAISNAKWHQIAFTDSNVASATKLQTARTIWGQNFDGTGNVSGDISNTSSIAFDTSAGAPNIGYLWTNTRGMHMDMSGLGTEQQGANLTLTPSGRVCIGTVSSSGKLDVYNNTGTTVGLAIDGGLSAYGYLYNEIIIKHNGVFKASFGANSVASAYISGGAVGTYMNNGVSGEFISLLNEGGTYIKGNLLATGGITMYSDQRKKTILNHVELSLKQIAEAPLIEHYYNSDENKTTHVGSIAQYWASMNDWFCKLDSEGYYTMEIQNAALASAISIARELDRYETKTDKDIKKLKKRIYELEEEVERLKAS